MLYSKLTTKARIALNEYIDFDIPIIGHDTFYQQAPLPGVPMTPIRLGRTEGYDSIDLFWQEVCSFLGFNPYKIKEFQINTRGLSTAVPDVINAFMGVTETYNDNHGNFWPSRDPDTGGNATGTTWLAVGYSAAQATFGNTEYGSGGTYAYNFHNVIKEYTESGADIAITSEFDIWPEACIKSGYIDVQHLNSDSGLYRFVHLIFHIYRIEATQKYNYAIYLESGNTTQEQTDYMNDVLNTAPLGHVYNPANPLDNKQEDGTEGGDGDFNNDSDPVDVPDLPTLDVSDLGGINLYKVTANDVKALFDYLNSNAPGDAILKWCTNPIQGIISLHVLPYPVDTASGGAAIKMMGITATGTVGLKIKQFQEWDLGGVHVDYGFGNTFLDYAPWSSCQIYLPFIGIRPMDMDEVVGHTVNVVYQFDNISGACVAFVTIDGAVRYSYAGSCAIGIPISQSNWGQTYIAAATSAAGALAGGIGGAASAALNGSSKLGIAAEGLAGAVQGSGGLDSIVAKPTVSRSGSISGAASALGVPHPYLIIERPDKAKVANPAPVTGLMCGRTLPLSSLSGYNIIEHIHLSGIAATGEELEEIERLLYQGVVF